MSLSIAFEKSTDKDGITYSDLHLDIVKHEIPYGFGGLARKSGKNDIRSDLDEQAIGNSLKNLFTTRPMQRLLNPEYGLDLTQFLFEPVNEISAKLIARKIINSIKKYESRV